MLFKELTREEDLEISRLDGYEEGERAGFTKGERAGAERGAMQKQCEIAKSLRESGIPIDVIAKNTGLSEAEIELHGLPVQPIITLKCRFEGKNVRCSLETSDI